MSYAHRNTKGKLTGKWMADAVFDEGNGTSKRHHLQYPTKSEADGVEAYFRATGQLPPHLVKAPTMTYADAVGRFKEKHRAWLAAGDGHTNAQRLEWSVGYLGKLDIAAVRFKQLEDYVEHLEKHCGRAGNPPSFRTINRYLDAVGKVLKYALKLELIPGLPAVPRKPDEGADRDAVSWDAEDRICAWMVSQGFGQEAFLTRLLAGTGMRCGELFVLRATQIETPEQVENTGWKLEKEQTKKKRARWIPCVPEAAKKLRAIIASNHLGKQTHLAHVFKRAVKASGENPRHCIHSLRHSANTRMLDTQAREIDVARIIGHKMKGQQDNYYHPDKPVLFAVAEKVQLRLGEIEKKSEVLVFNLERKSA